MAASECVFCQIAQKKVPAEIIFEDDQVLAFPDINPSAEIHILIIPKTHIESVMHLEAEHAGLLYQMLAVAKKLVVSKDLANTRYRLVFNGGLAQHIPHLHLHLLAGEWLRRE